MIAGSISWYWRNLSMRMRCSSVIRRWCYEAQRRGIKLERILIHPDDLAEALALSPWLPVKVLGSSFCR